MKQLCYIDISLSGPCEYIYCKISNYRKWEMFLTSTKKEGKLALQVTCKQLKQRNNYKEIRDRNRESIHILACLLELYAILHQINTVCGK